MESKSEDDKGEKFTIAGLKLMKEDGSKDPRDRDVGKPELRNEKGR